MPLTWRERLMAKALGDLAANPNDPSALKAAQDALAILVKA